MIIELLSKLAIERDVLVRYMIVYICLLAVGSSAGPFHLFLLLFY